MASPTEAKVRYFNIRDGACLLVEERCEQYLKFRLLRRDGMWIDGWDAGVDVISGSDIFWDEITEKEAEGLAAMLHGSISDAFLIQESPEVLKHRSEIMKIIWGLWKNVAVPEGTGEIK